MKKTFLTIAIVLGMTIGAFAQQGGGLFGMGPQRNSYENQYEETRTGGLLSLPGSHGETEDQPTDAPLGSGALLLIGFGAAYALKKRNEK